MAFQAPASRRARVLFSKAQSEERAPREPWRRSISRVTQRFHHVLKTEQNGIRIHGVAKLKWAFRIAQTKVYRQIDVLPLSLQSLLAH